MSELQSREIQKGKWKRTRTKKKEHNKCSILFLRQKKDFRSKNVVRDEMVILTKGKKKERKYIYTKGSLFFNLSLIPKAFLILLNSNHTHKII